MPAPPEHAARTEDPPEYYGATVHYDNCLIYQGPFQRLSRTTPAFLREALTVELEDHARLHRAGKITMCSPRGEFNDIYRLPVSDDKKVLQWLVGETFTTTWDDKAGIFHIITERNTV